MDCLIYGACCPVGCRLVADFVAAKVGGVDTINTRKERLLGGYLFSDNESNEISQENLKSKKRWSDDRLQVFRGLLPDFVAGSLCLAFLIYGGSLWRKPKSKKTS